MFSLKSNKPKQCVFCDIAHNVPSQKKNRQPSRILYRNERFFVLVDIAPATDTHLLAIPVRHIVDANSLRADDAALVLQMQAKLRELLAAEGYDVNDPAQVSMGFHLPPFISVPHLHMHAMAPIAKLDTLGRWKFAQNNRTYCSVQFALEKLSGRDK